jgi:uncharacterized damage-inducible protein DinB
MSKLELIRDLYSYNEWANRRLLGTASLLTQEKLAAARSASWGNLLTDFAHIGAAQVAWLLRWQQGANPVSTVELQGADTLDRLRERMERSHADLQEYIAGLTDERLDTVLYYRDSRGNEAERPLWQLMVHVANHGTYHRGETAGALTDLGHSPGDLDFVFWELGLR